MLRRGSVAAIATAAILAFVACGGGSSYRSAASATRAPATEARAGADTLTLTSDAFANNGNIAVKYSCSGEATSPPLAWSRAGRHDGVRPHRPRP